ncbi:hypothetical protein BMJ27_07515 [Sinorhizobium medicae]|uniref:hypothetical protein n=1 Tax=Sinorhizobium medicae TaxID=110321 RepID=UPI000C796820|nr:hypothetical protein [Sinorhizobium medicae]PLU38001.1 hypothetical protein BMJ27_07515 [Sinorhizobium medicae]
MMQTTETFHVGQCVNHVSGGMPSIVVDASTTANGLKLYSLWEIKPAEARRERWMRGDVLVAMTGREPGCDGCGLAQFCSFRQVAA